MTNLGVRPLIGNRLGAANLQWEVFGYLRGQWMNVPFASFAEAQEWINERSEPRSPASGDSTGETK